MQAVCTTLRKKGKKKKKKKKKFRSNPTITMFKILIDKNKIIRRSSSSHHKGKAQVTKSSKQLDLSKSTIEVFR